MSNQPHSTENRSHSDNLHGKVALLLDAYSTNELEHNEQEEVEQHLASCSECQYLLITIRHFRGLFTRLATDDSWYNINRGTALLTREQQPSFLANSVFDEITKSGRGTMKLWTIPGIKQKDLPLNSPSKRRSRLFSLALIAAVLCIALLTDALVVTFTSHHQFSKPPKAAPALRAWQMQQGQLVAHDAAGTFSIKYINITSQEFRIFYTFKSLHQGVPHVRVVSFLASNPGTSTELVATVQSLGQLGTFNVGVVHVHRQNRVGQIIELQITPSRKSASTWRLTPLKQLRDDPSASHSFSPQQTGLPQVVWYGPVMAEQVAFFKNTEVNQPELHSLHIFVRLDDPVAVTAITQNEYLALAGAKNLF